MVKAYVETYSEQKSMALTQERMKSLIPKMRAAAEKAALDAKAGESR
jgi:hypothetical protein